jgi:PBSX family phage terminase large subunit
MELLLKQNKAIYFLKDKETTEVLYGGAAGGGKSALGCLWLIEQCLNYPNTRWLMGRAVLKTLKETTLNTFHEVSNILDLNDLWNYNQQKGVIEFYNGSEIILKDLFHYVGKDANFDSLGSLEISGAFIDECNQVVFKAWQIVKSRIRYKLKEYNLTPKILGTCNPAKNWTYTNFFTNLTKLKTFHSLESLCNHYLKITHIYQAAILNH